MPRKFSKLQCLNCYTVLESKHGHDFRQCDCPNKTFVDGGSYYLRYGGVDLKFIRILVEPDTEEEQDPLPKP